MPSPESGAARALQRAGARYKRNVMIIDRRARPEPALVLERRFRPSQSPACLMRV